MQPTQRVLNDVWDERLSQDQKWGEQNHDNPTWAAILGEEYGEAMQALLHIKFNGRLNLDDLRDELVQVAAVAVAWAECLDRNDRRL